MQLPFSTEQFLGTFVTYNRAWAPLPLLAAVLAGAGSLRAVVQPRRYRALLVGVGVLWIWTGTAYFLAIFAAMTPAAYLFAAAFVAEGFLVLRHARGGGQVGAQGVDRPRFVLGVVLIAYALLLYPTVGWLAGQRYPAMPTFTLPCPTTIFTLGIFAWRGPSLPWRLLVVPGLWAVIATSAAASFGIVEDFALPLAFVALVVLRVARRGTVVLRRA